MRNLLNKIAIALFLLLSLRSSAQTTFNNLIVKTNLTAGLITSPTLTAISNTLSSSIANTLTEGLVTSGQGNFFSTSALTGDNFTSRIAVTNRVNASGIRIWFSGWQNPNGAPAGTGNNQPVKVSVQLADGSGNPTGTPIPVFFNGVRYAYVYDRSVIESDPGITVTNGQKTFILTYQSANNTGVHYANRYMSGQPGEDYGTGDLTDTASGFNTDDASAAVNFIAPCFVTGTILTSDKKGVAVLGDSIAVGESDIFTPNRGFAGRAIGSSLPYVNLALGGATAQGLADMSVSWAAYIPLHYCKSAFIEPGRNDITIGSTYPNITNYLGQLITICRTAGIQRVVGCTIKPRTPISSNGWTTTGGQTAETTVGVRTNVNNWIATSPAYDAYYDLSAVLTDSGNPALNATGPAVSIFAGTAGATTSTHSVASTSAALTWTGATILVGTNAASVNYTFVGVRGWMGFEHLLPGTFASGDSFTIYSSWTGDGTHPNGFGNAAAAATFNVSTLFP